MRRVGAILAVLAVCVAAALAVGADGGEGAKGKTYEIVFDNAFGLTEGGDFKIAGVRAGNTSSFEVVGQERPLAVVKAEVTEPGFSDLREDARCEIRPQSLIGEYYVDCQPGASDRKLPDGGRVPVEQTSSTIPADLVNSILRRPYRERFRLIVAELGAGLAGRPEDLSEVLRRAHPALRETSETLEILGRQRDTIEKFITDADRVIGELEARKEDVTRFVREAGTTAEISASRRAELAETFRRFPAFLTELEPYMGRLADLTNAQQPVLRDLQAASGELDTFLTRLEPFSAEAVPAFEALGDASLVGRRAVRVSQEEIRELRRLGRDAPGLAKPLRQFLQTLDDRARAVEPDPRAAATDPPAGDKTHISGRGGGFTGMEALWNYFYWQTLTTNALDDVGHVLRLSVIVNECSPYSTNPSPALLEECNEFLGPTQPGVTTPDPTETSEAASATASTTARRRPRGQGQTHGSDPNTRRRPASRAVIGQRPARDGLLDFLLAE
jgi:phospholipid/cholesterol/gamma-HCH transport system substrate-binding protein